MGGAPVMRSAQPSAEPAEAWSAVNDHAAEIIAEFQNRPDEIPDDNNRQNLASLERNWDAHENSELAGDTNVPDSVREVITSSGRSLDASIQRAVEDPLGDSFGDVRIHTGPEAANACEDINARAFTVGNHIAFNAGEYDPAITEGQHLLAHELAHVRQQTGAAISMMPQADAELEIDPDPQLEREAEETAQRVMEGGELGIQRLKKTEVRVQRVPGGAPIPGAGGSLSEEGRTREDEEADDDKITLRTLLKGAVKAGLSTGIVATLVQSGALEAGLTDPETAMVTGTASVAAAAGLTAKTLAYQKLDPQVWRQIFAAAGREDLLVTILQSIGYEPDWADETGETRFD